MEPSWSVLGPEPARFSPAPGQAFKALAYSRSAHLKSSMGSLLCTASFLNRHFGVIRAYFSVERVALRFSLTLNLIRPSADSLNATIEVVSNLVDPEAHHIPAQLKKPLIPNLIAPT
jgi:hypothetical protein